MTEQKRTDSSQQIVGATKLYAIFHGEIMFFDDGQPGNKILGLAPAMDIHVYAAGPWLAEQRIPPGLTLELKGVKSGQFSFQNKQDLTVLFGGGDPKRKNEEEKPYLTLRLPRPDNIISGGRISLEGVSIVPDSGQSVCMGGSIAHALIFEYTPSEQRVPTLVVQDGGKELNKMNQAMCWQAADVGNGTYNLHVFAEADVTPSPQHIKEASEMGLALAGIAAVFTVQPKDILVNHFMDVPRDKVPTGLLWEEVNFNLARRASMSSLLTKALHQGDLKKGVTIKSTSIDPAVSQLVGQDGCGSYVVVPKAVGKPRS